MQAYASKQALIDEITKRARLFIDEFRSVDNLNKDSFVDEVDRTPSQMIAYQLGWMNLILSWEQDNKDGKEVITPTPDYKWNNLGGLYQHFYDQYADHSLDALIDRFERDVTKIIQLIESYQDNELFEQGGRQWATTTPSSWPIWKWLHINTVAPFKSFRAKIRKWKKLSGI
ncbi:ClbS/DfsB family four-helix bundle protein [Virgibacillus sp. NKC19-3]|uniref:ClbS/DfsB family four-helix bundle protein n=1 Tax=Virgibacillus saliphilus TaxID=2831674 RepID=UPI001C9B179D|nr:ClbS/DfsB family four-helix bundle protein [Virgibacillus sp. NKC19-3]MBY7144886.1 ClbS/DfsB family four-helix bundle protein [Virgibacillus sp. NKC19-3]